MNKSDLNALQYIVNTNGHATMEHFIEDHEPIGHILWNSLILQGLAEFGDDRIVKLTEKGKTQLELGK